MNNILKKIVAIATIGIMMAGPAMGTTVAELQEQIDSVKDQVSRIIVVTRHVPFRECVTYHDKLPWDFFSAFMGSAGLGDICVKEPLVTHALFGHTHCECFEKIRGIQAVCSPVGYLTKPPENLRDHARKRLKVIEVE